MNRMNKEQELTDSIKRTMDLAQELNYVFVGLMADETGVRVMESWPAFSAIQVPHGVYKHSVLPKDFRGSTDAVKTVNVGIGVLDVLKKVYDDLGSCLQTVIKNYHVKMGETIAPKPNNNVTILPRK